jgi:uncharacterized protein (TIGR02145 family)
VPSDAEWIVLTDFLGGEAVAGGKLKSTGTIEAGTGLWYAPNINAINISGFSAPPSGYKAGSNDLVLVGEFNYLLLNGNWWSASQYSNSAAWDRGLYYDYQYILRNFNAKQYGFSVRCLRD